MCNTYHLHSQQLVDLLSHLPSAFRRATSLLSGFLQTEKRCRTSSFLKPELTRISIKTARSKWDCLYEVFPQNWNVKKCRFYIQCHFSQGSISRYNLCFSNIFKYLILETFAQLIAKFRNTAYFRMFTQSSQTCQEQADQPQLFSWKPGERLLVHTNLCPTWNCYRPALRHMLHSWA